MILKSSMAFAALAVSLLASSAALAADKAPAVVSEKRPSIFYSAYRAGFVWSNDSQFNLRATSAKNPYDLGVFAASATGMSLERLGLRNFRGEIESGINRAYMSPHLSTAGTSSVTGETRQRYVIANLGYDFETGGNLRPYVTAGGGYNAVHVRESTVAPHPADPVSAKGGAYVLQAGVGFSHLLGAGFHLELGYRYMLTPHVGLTALDGTTTISRLADHKLLLGLRRNW